MPLKSSKGLRNYMLDSGSLKAALADGLLKIYAGTIPPTADDALGAATLLCTISDNATGGGIEFEVNAVDGAIAKKASETWKGVNAASATRVSRGASPNPISTSNKGKSAVRGMGCNPATKGSAILRTATDQPMSMPNTMPTVPPTARPMPMR